jgi:hypothetical protein
MHAALIGTVAMLLLPVPAPAGEPVQGDEAAFRLSPGDGWAAGRRPPKQPLLDVPMHLLGSPPEAVADLYWRSLSRGDDGRIVAGTIPLRLTATEIGGEEGQAWKAQLSVLGNDAWPDRVLPTGNKYAETTFDPVLQMSRVRYANDPNAVLYHTDPRAPDFVWVRCFFRDASRIGPEAEGNCWLNLSAVANIASSVQFPASELPQWRGRADRLQSLTLAWARSPDEWPLAQDFGDAELDQRQ